MRQARERIGLRSQAERGAGAEHMADPPVLDADSGRPANWAGNVVFTADRVRRPRTIEELRALVAASERVRAVGTGHSFSRIADTPGVLVSVAGLPPVIDIDTGRASVKVSAGVRYGDLAVRLHAAGYALHNLGSLPHISVAGACATATHGSGDRNGNLATAVSAIEMVTADGKVAVLRRGDDDAGFAGAVVGLGALGVVTTVTLDLVPAFDVRQYVYEDLPAAQLNACFGEIFSSGYSVSVFTDWQGPLHNQMWIKCRADPAAVSPPEQRWMGARLADGPRHPLPGGPAANCTEQQGLPGPWHERLPHFRLDFTPSSGAELQSEYLVPRHLGVTALAAVAALRDRLAPVLQISEIRTVASDNLWMSPSYRRDTIGLHFTWTDDVRAVTPAIAAVEERLAPLGARPHWGKLFGTAPAALTALYERTPDFRALMRHYDPAGKFRNDFIDRYFP
jgi:xylitol oxidase